MNFYPRSPCGERRVHYDNYNLHCVISIHALLAESDGGFGVGSWLRGIFLSTLSLRRATLRVTSNTRSQPDFYPRSPCGERPWQRGSRVTYVEFLSTLSLRRATIAQTAKKTSIAGHFYPRSPCGERLMHALKLANAMLFLSTLSLRRATGSDRGISCNTAISIHALLAESDKARSKRINRNIAFLSTLSLRRATEAIKPS